MKNLKLYIIAGEASGDLHASNLMNGLYEVSPEVAIRFRGGESMEKSFLTHSTKAALDNGAGMAFDYREGAVMGFAELIGKAGTLLGNLSATKSDIASFSPDAIILVDYPGFNLRIAKWAHRKGIKVFYYIAPKVWASREWRIRLLKKYVDRLFIVFPFEKDYFESKGVPFTYCGNPLVDAVAASRAMTTSPEQLKRELGLKESDKIVALLAGSRRHEVKSMMELYNETAARIHAMPQYADYKFIIAGAPGRTEEDYGQFDRSYINLLFGKTQEIVRVADTAVINSGTASLECVLIGTPQVVVFKVPSAFTYYLAKWFLLKCKYISLGNLCLDRLAFRELYTREDCNADNITDELVRLLSDKKYRAAMENDYAAIRTSLGRQGASRAFAEAIISEL